MKLNKKQKSHLLEGVAEGLETGEINKRASKFKPPYKVSRSQVDFYRKTREVELQKIKEQEELDALKSGLSIKENRVRVLHNLAERLRKDLLDDDKLWLPEVKSIGSGLMWERIDYKVFNAPEVVQLRGVLDDIASEVGERIRKQEMTGKDGQPLIPGQPKISDSERMSKMRALALAIAEEMKKNESHDKPELSG